jgi:hypothetical protein
VEFAFSAVILLLLLLPGFILQTAYTKGRWRWNSPTLVRPLAEQILSGIVTAGALHILWFWIASCLKETINLRVLVMFLLGSFGHDDEHFNDALDVLVRHPLKIALYFSSLYVFAALAGLAVRGLVRWMRWDHKYRFLRFNNEWYYLLSGEIHSFQETPDIEGETKGVYLTTVVHHSNVDYLYTGFVIDYFFDRNGNLDRVILDEVARRRLSDDKSEEMKEHEEAARFYEIEGHYFVLRYSEMCTINLDYLIFEKDEYAVPEITIEDADALIAEGSNRIITNVQKQEKDVNDNNKANDHPTQLD